ncbi:uncharacterized protein [Nicotiana tomentosiformis]|uniref:uncharacterized protein n=1 Tax=Nicotiana tomentosiformis TaxID=4098 RepID=UPI00388C7ADF
MAIFTDMIEKFVEVVMDDFPVIGLSFDELLMNLSKMLAKCEEINLVLNWKKCHFMVQEGIVIGHKVSKDGLEVDKSKVEAINKLPPPISVEGVRSFLGHAFIEKELLAVIWAFDKFVACLEFDLEIRYPKGTENQAADQFSHLETRAYVDEEGEIKESFPDEQFPTITVGATPWYADYVKFIISWCETVSLRRILKYINDMNLHMEGTMVVTKWLQKYCNQGFYQPTLFKNAHAFVKRCDFMGTFPYSNGHRYILVAVDYVSMWVEVVGLPIDDAKVVVNFVKKNIFTRFGTPRALISDRGTHFCNKLLENLLAKYGVKHKIIMVYHSQMSGQVEVSNREVKQMLEKIVNASRKDWAPS